MTYTFPGSTQSNSCRIGIIVCYYQLSCIVSCPLVFWDIPFYFVARTISLFMHIMGLFISLCTVLTKWTCTHSHVSTQGSLIVSFCVFSLPNWSFISGCLQNYLVLIIVICPGTWLNNRYGGSKRFICVEHNWKKHDLFSLASL